MNKDTYKKFEKNTVNNSKESIEKAILENAEKESLKEINVEKEANAEKEAGVEIKEQVTSEISKNNMVLFKFNRNVKYGKACVSKNEPIAINREDAISFANANYGEIIKVGG